MKLQEFNSLGDRDKHDYIMTNFRASNAAISSRRLVLGFGFNDSSYISNPIVDGSRVRCPAYSAWANMLSRSLSKKYQERFPTYHGVKVCDEWRSFMSFRGWWIENQVDGWELDKDLVGSGKIYSPDDCVFIPPWLNNFTNDHGSARGALPVGACFHKASGKFMSQIKNTKTGEKEYLGYFDFSCDAHYAWKNRKLEIALDLKSSMDAIDSRIHGRVVDIINKMK